LPKDWRPESDDPRFLAARRELVTLFIRELREDFKRNGIDLPVGVYNSNVYGQAPSLHDVCQDWQAWDAEGLVNEHHPMFYFDNLTRLGRAVASLTRIKRSDSIVFGPVFLPRAHFRTASLRLRRCARGGAPVDQARLRRYLVLPCE